MVEPERNNCKCVGMPANHIKDPGFYALAIFAIGLHHVKACACMAVW